MRTLRLLIDLDGVSADCYTRWFSLYNAEYNDDLDVSRVKSWDVHFYVKKECGKGIYKYLNRPNFFQELEPIEGCQEVLEYLHGRGHEILIVTSTPRGAKTGHYDKIQWVKKYLPFVPTKNVISTHRKDAIYGDILLDDGPHNLEHFPGITCIFDHPHNHSRNSDFEADYRVYNWFEFKDLVDRLSNES